MDYQEQLQAVHTATELQDRETLESIKSTMETDRVTNENMGNSIVLMAVENALAKITEQMQKTETPEWRTDQTIRTGGTAEDLEQKTREINERMQKSILLGRKNIISAIPESLRTNAQRSELADVIRTLEEIPVAIDFAPEKLNVIKNIQSETDRALEQSNDYMSSKIALGTSLWDVSSDDNDDPISFTQPIQPTVDSIDQSHKDYLRNQIDTISSEISAGFGNDEILERGIELEKKLDSYNQPPVTTPEISNTTLESKISDEKESLPSLEPVIENEKNNLETIITGLTRDDLGLVYNILKEHGPIDGQSSDQIFSAIKLFMRGASDASHIPETFGLRAKMEEIKKIRDAEHANLGISIDKDSGAVSVDYSVKPTILQQSDNAPVAQKTVEQNPDTQPGSTEIITMKERQDRFGMALFQTQSLMDLMKTLSTEPIVQDVARSEPTLFTQYSIINYLKDYQAGKNPNPLSSITPVHAISLQTQKLIDRAKEQGTLDQEIKQIMTTYSDLASKSSIGFADLPPDFQQQVASMEQVVDPTDPMVSFLKREYGIDVNEKAPDPQDPMASFLQREYGITVAPDINKVSQEQKQSTPEKTIEIQSVVGPESQEPDHEDVEDDSDETQKEIDLESDHEDDSELTLPKQSPEDLFNEKRSPKNEDFIEDVQDQEYSAEILKKNRNYELRLMNELIRFTDGKFTKEYGEKPTLDEKGYIVKQDGTSTNIMPSMIDYYGEIKKNKGMSPEEFRQYVLKQEKESETNNKIAA